MLPLYFSHELNMKLNQIFRVNFYGLFAIFSQHVPQQPVLGTLNSTGCERSDHSAGRYNCVRTGAHLEHVLIAIALECDSSCGRLYCMSVFIVDFLFLKWWVSFNCCKKLHIRCTHISRLLWLLYF